MVSHLFGGGTPTGELVLILIVMDNGLSQQPVEVEDCDCPVLILIVMDNGLSPPLPGNLNCSPSSLNPYCNG